MAVSDASPVIADASAHRSGRALWLWAALAASTLGFAGIFAFLLALSRIPGIEAIIVWPVAFFEKGLVIHVVFSFVVWFLSVLAACAVLMARRIAPTSRLPGVAGTLAAALALLSLPLLFTPALLDRGEPTLNNYVPVIIDPLYYAGLVVLAAAVALTVGGLWARLSLATVSDNPTAAAVACAGALFGVAVVCVVIAAALSIGETPSYAWNENLFWGGGHILQFANTALMIAAWSLLLGRVAPLPRPAPAAVTVAALLLLVGGLPGPLFYVLFEPFSADQTRAFTLLQYLLGAPALIAAVAVLGRLPRPAPTGDVAVLALVLSMIVFAVGGVFGFFVDGADTRTPAHYHLMIAAVTVAFMGLFHTVLLPELGRPPANPRRCRLQVHLFAWGQLLASIGLFVAGGYGAPRKVAGDAQGLDVFWAQAGMAMNGIGGLIAVAGGALFVWIVGAALLRRAVPLPLASGSATVPR